MTQGLFDTKKNIYAMPPAQKNQKKPSLIMKATRRKEASWLRLMSRISIIITLDGYSSGKKAQHLSRKRPIMSFLFSISQRRSTTYDKHKCSKKLKKREGGDHKLFVIGHAGGDPVNFCENTLEATRSALALGANAIEVDLVISKDGVVFLWHDPTPFSIHALVRR